MNRETVRRLRADLLQAPRPHGDVVRERTVGPLELFFDLVVVVLVAQAARRLASHLSAHELYQFSVVFTLVWIAWLNGTLLHELHGREDARSRNVFLGQILLLVPLAAFMPQAGGAHGRAFAVNAGLLFLLIGFLWWRAGRGDIEDFTRTTALYVWTTVAFAVIVACSDHAEQPRRIRRTGTSA
jgi:low temperature requirement protein LtrA